jgi:hypothetical protein
MTKREEKGQTTALKYLALMKIISTMENRLARTETFYLVLNVFIYFVSTAWLTLLKSISFSHVSSNLGSVFILFSQIMGIIICIFWIGFAMRLQLKLKLRYFQARYLERKMEVSGENFFSDENIFFNPKLRKIESPDKKELLEYPTKGLFKLEGYIGALKPRYMSWTLPYFFVILYMLTFIYTVLGALFWK